MFRAPILASVAAFALLTTPLTAQDGDVAAERDAAFQEMLADPSNRLLMQRYAQLSVQLRDFEAAAATLERLVDLEPENTAARVELAIAYFALGSYEVADYHLSVALSSGALTPQQIARVTRYQQESASRNDGTELGGRVQAGLAYARDSEETGALLNAAVNFRFDLGDANVTMWATEFAYTNYQPDDNSRNARQSARLRTGPELRISGDAYGPRVQPYLQVEWLDRDPTLSIGYTSVALGASYQNPINERFTAYADAHVGRASATETTGVDFEFHEAALGLTYRPSRDTRFRVTTWLEEQREVDITSPATTNTTGLRLSAEHAFNPAFSSLPNSWVAGGWAGLQQIDRDIAGSLTETDETSFGAYLRAFVFEDIYVETAVAQVMQDSVTGGLTTETEESILSVQLGWEF
ncbi:tetratricopeptide repeat protein [Gymnodinialimonas ulvae]|uniref:tetratricopeptide repeat protein n=1 Tax=Gymnodinialimonas ulvae TaxID=3126504 RepID=UPI0030A64A3C